MNLNSRPVSVEHISIAKAYTELKHRDFACWIRLMVATDDELAAGRVPIAKMLGYSEAQSNAVIRVLKHAGYVKVVPNDIPNRPTQLVLLKRATLSGRDRFIRLSRFAMGGNVDPVMGENVDLDFDKNVPERGFPPQSEGIDHDQASAVAPSLLKTQQSASGPTAVTTSAGKSIKPLEDPFHAAIALLRNKINELEQQSSAVFCHNPQGNLSAFTRQIAEPSNDQNQPVKKVKCWVLGEVPGVGVSHDKPKQFGEKNSQVDISKIVKLKNSKKPKLRNSEGVSPRGRGRAVDWSKFTPETVSGVTFSPSKDRLKAYRKLLARKESDPLRAQLVNRLAWILSQEYAKYVAAKLGKNIGLTPKDFQRAQQGAVELIQKGVTPGQVLKYWDKHIHTFHGGRMRYPTLTLICSNWGVEQAACAMLDASGDPLPPRERSGWGNQAPAPKAHGFSDLDELDKRLRPALKAAGYDVDGMGDDMMLYIQKTSIPMARGIEQAIDPSVKPMVRWAAKHLAARWIADSKAAR